jgi:hypothetical protein
MTVKDFDAIAAARRAEMGEPPSFKLGGTTFHCLPEIPATAVFEFMDSDTAAGLVDFLISVIAEDQKAAFQGLLSKENTSVLIAIEDLNDIYTWLNEQYAGGDPKAPSNS